MDDLEDPGDDRKDADARILAALILCDPLSADYLKRFGEQAGSGLNVRLTQQELLQLQRLVRLIAASMRDGRDGQLLRVRIVVQAMTDYSVNLTQRRLFAMKSVKAASEQFPMSNKSMRMFLCTGCGRTIPYAHTAPEPCETFPDDGSDLPCNGSWKEKTLDTTSEERISVANSLIVSLCDIEPRFAALSTNVVCEVLQKGWSPARATVEFCQMFDVFDDKDKDARKRANLYGEIWRQELQKQTERSATAGIASSGDDLDIPF